MGDPDDGLRVAHLLAIPRSLVVVAGAIGVAAKLAELGADDGLVCLVHDLFDHSFEAVGGLSRVASLVSAHVRVEVVHHELLACLAVQSYQ